MRVSSGRGGCRKRVALVGAAIPIVLLVACGTENTLPVEVSTTSQAIGEVELVSNRDYIDQKGRLWTYVGEAEFGPEGVGAPEPPRVEQSIQGLDPERIARSGLRRLTMIDGKGYIHRSDGGGQELLDRIADAKATKQSDKTYRGTNPGPYPEDFIGHVVVGTDNRIEVTGATSPWDMIGLAYTTTQFWCTAELIGSRTAITGAHCHYNRGAEAWYPVASFQFGHDMTGSGAGTATWVVGSSNFTVTITDDFIDEEDASWLYDFAIIDFATTPGNTVGYFGTDAVPPTDSRNWYTYGYPDPSEISLAGYRWGEPWGHYVSGYFGGSSSPISLWPDSTSPNWLVWHTLDATNGQSGSGLYYNNQGDRYIVSTHQGNNGTTNSGTRLGSIYVPWIETFSSYWEMEESWGSHPYDP